MSRGHGHVQRALLDLIASDQIAAWPVGEICRRIYGATPQRKHRVAVDRALDRVTLPEPWEILHISGPGSERVVFNACSLISRARINWLDQNWTWPDIKFVRRRLLKGFFVPAALEYMIEQSQGHMEQMADLLSKLSTIA
jgi:hypothetical protein